MCPNVERLKRKMGSRDTTPEVSPPSSPLSPVGVLDSEQEEGELSDDDLSVIRSAFFGDPKKRQPTKPEPKLASFFFMKSNI